MDSRKRFDSYPPQAKRGLLSRGFFSRKSRNKEPPKRGLLSDKASSVKIRLDREKLFPEQDHTQSLTVPESLYLVYLLLN